MQLSLDDNLQRQSSLIVALQRPKQLGAERQDRLSITIALGSAVSP